MGASESEAGDVVALSGGVGGARLAAGLTHHLPRHHLSVVVNTADDFEPYGLAVSPDVDTVLYTLSGRVNEAEGWGRSDDSDTVVRGLRSLGVDPWFFLGDRDLAVHLARTAWLRDGCSPTLVTQRLAEALGAPATVLPMTDGVVRTRVLTSEGEVSFQEWFVRQRCEPAAVGLRYEGADAARPTASVMDALERAEVIVIGPSNPYLSVAPILALPGLVEHLAACRAPVVAVSPVIGGAAVKGPTARMLDDLAGTATPVAVADMYGLFLDGMVVDDADGQAAAPLGEMGVAVHRTDILMRDPLGRARLAGEVLDFARLLAEEAPDDEGP